MRICMVGSGYVGLVSGACFADFGHDVVCVDKDAGKIAGLRKPARSRSTSRAWMRWSPSNAAAGRLTFTTDLAAAVADADAVFIAVGTPSRRGDGHADLSYVYAAAREIAAALEGFTVVVTKSTVPVGTGDEVERIIRETNPNADFAVVSNPEFLREGAAIDDFKRPDRIVVGTEDERGARGDGRALSPALSSTSRRCCSPTRRTSELIKYAANALPGDEDHLHQRDGRPLRGGRRRRAGGRARHRPRQPHRLASSCMPAPAMAAPASRRIRWRWSRPPRTPAAPLRLVETTVADQRRAQAGDGAEGHRGLRRRRARQDHRRARPRPSSPTPTTCAMRRRFDHPGAARRRRPCQVYDPEGMEHAGALLEDVVLTRPL